MSPLFPFPVPGRPLELLILHPAGSADAAHASLSIGILEFLRMWLQTSGLSVSLWLETVVEHDGRARFVLRPTAWGEDEIRRRRYLFPLAKRVLYLNITKQAPPEAILALEASPQDRALTFPVRLDAAGAFQSLPFCIDRILEASGGNPLYKDGPALFDTTDAEAALEVLYTFERTAAFAAGVGRDDPSRLFEPALRCLERRPGHSLVRSNLVSLAAGFTDHTSGETLKAACGPLERWCELAPLSPVPAIFLSLARLRSGLAEPARAAMEEALRRDPVNRTALEQYAGWLAERGFVDRGVELLKNAVGQTEYDGNLLDLAGCLLANAGRVREAEPLFRYSIAAGGPPTAAANLARALLEWDRDDEALSALEEGLSAGVDSSQLDLLATLAKRTGVAAARARAILRGRIAEGSTDEQIQQRLTELSLETDGPLAAQTHAVRLLGVATGAPSRRFAYLVLLSAKMPDFEKRWNAGIAEALQGDAQSAVAFFQEVVACEPSFGPAHFFLAASLERTGRAREALQHAEKAVEFDPTDPVPLDLAARIHSDVGSLEEAVRFHHAAAYLAQEDPRILRNAAVTMLKAGFPTEGVSAARASLAIQPDQMELVALLKKLDTPDRSLLGKLTGKLRKLSARSTPT